MKYVKNITQSNIIVAGINIPADSFYEFKGYDDMRFGMNSRLESQIDNDQILGSKDGVTLLSKDDSKKLLLKVNSASGTFFDDANVPFQAKDTQEAIEQVLTSPAGVLDVYTFCESGSASNKWLEHAANSIYSDQSPALLPFDCKLIACTFVNDDDGVDTDIQIHKAIEGNGSNSNLISTFQIRDKRVARFSNFTPIQFNAGDKVSVFLKDQGTNPSRIIVKLYFLITNYNKENSGENYSSDFSLSIGGITISIGS